MEGKWGKVSAELRLLICVVGIYFFYLYYGILQERIYKATGKDGESKFTFTFFLLFVQCVVNALFAWAGVLFLGGNRNSKALGSVAETAPIGGGRVSGTIWVAMISLSYLLAMSASNQALQFVSYPFQALAKSCKMIPVMLGNVVIGGKRYSLKEYICVGLITAGVALFQFAKKSPTSLGGSSTFGLLLLATSLTLDGYTSSNQQLFTNEFSPTAHTLMLYMNLFSMVFLVPILAFTGQGLQGWNYCLENPGIQYDILMFALCSAAGQNFIFYTITGPGPLACTTITTTRKFFTILLSVLMYPENSLNTMQWLSIVLVFLGLGIELHDKYTKTRPRQKLDAKKTQ